MDVQLRAPLPAHEEGGEVMILILCGAGIVACAWLFLTKGAEETYRREMETINANASLTAKRKPPKATP